VIDQANWNIDPMDGAGPSGYTADWTKRQIFGIQLQWLGVGDVVLGLSIDRKLWPVHIFANPNSGAQFPYMRRAYLPIRYEIENVSSGTGATLRQICSTAVSYGGFNPRGKIFAARTPALVSLSTNNETFAMAARLKTTKNRLTLNPLTVNAVCTSAGYVLIRVYLYATLTTPVWGAAFAGSTNSAVELATTAAGFSTTNAVCVQETGFSNLNDQLITQFENTLLAAADIAGTADIVLVTLQRIGGTQTETVSVAMQWQEY
jgi:hypothetical protein